MTIRWGAAGEHRHAHCVLGIGPVAGLGAGDDGVYEVCVYVNAWVRVVYRFRCARFRFDLSWARWYKARVVL